MKHVTLSLVFFTKIIFACRTTPTSNLESHAENSTVCCIDKKASGIWYESKKCGGETDQAIIACCEKGFLGFKTSSSETIDYLPFDCDKTPSSYLSKVSLCRGPTRFRQGNAVVGGISDAVSGLSQFAHVWVKTSNLEVGMGPKQWEKSDMPPTAEGQLAALFDAMRLDKHITVEWRDHSGYSAVEGSHCDPLFFCDEQCVENQLVIGTTLGYYSLLNQCHSASVKILRSCGCFNHCVSWLNGICTKRVFPELKGLNLEDESE